MRPDDFAKWHRDHWFYYHPNPRPPFRFCRRLFWFALGIGAHALWMKHKEKERLLLSTDATAPPTGDYGCGRSRWRLPERDANHGRMNGVPPPTETPLLAPTTAMPMDARTPPSQAASPSQQHFDRDWQVEHLRQVGKQATDVMTDMSDSALDSLMSSILAIKAKVAELRKQREKEQIAQKQAEPESRRHQDNDVPRLV